MELKEVIGRRRSIRFFQPYRPVEREKIQIILEAARLASCSVNATFLRAIIVERDKLPRETLDALKTPVSATNLEMAPLHIYFYGDLGTVSRAKGQTLKELVDVGVLTPSHGWSHQFVDNLVWPSILQPVYGKPATAGVPVAFDCGVAVCQALLAAFDEGLGACLSAFNVGIAKRVFNVPDDWLAIFVLLVGYPAESWEAGGQRPRPPFEELYFEGQYGAPFVRDETVVGKLRDAKMIQAPAPLPWRWDEIRALARAFGLPE